MGPRGVFGGSGIRNASVAREGLLDSRVSSRQTFEPAEGSLPMGPVVTRCGGCGVRVRLARPEVALGRDCPNCGFSLAASLGYVPPAPGTGEEARESAAVLECAPVCKW